MFDFFCCLGMGDGVWMGEWGVYGGLKLGEGEGGGEGMKKERRKGEYNGGC
jgi:hypothetical protein